MGCSPWGRTESDTTERLHFHFSLSYIGEGNGNPLQCSCLENPRDGEAWWAAVYGVAQNRTLLKRLSSSSSSRALGEQEGQCSVQGVSSIRNIIVPSPSGAGAEPFWRQQELYGKSASTEGVVSPGNTHRRAEVMHAHPHSLLSCCGFQRADFSWKPEGKWSRWCRLHGKGLPMAETG